MVFGQIDIFWCSCGQWVILSPIVGGKCWQIAVQVTCSSSVSFWNGYSVLRFSLNMHFYFFWACCCQKDSLKYYKALQKKKKIVAAFPYNKRWNHCNESVQTTCCILSSRMAPSLFPTHISQIPDFSQFSSPQMTGELAALCLSQAKAWTTVYQVVGWN